ncbi:MAG TPA: dienelactone hydrolase family protein [Burkholderiales bacterium]
MSWRALVLAAVLAGCAVVPSGMTVPTSTIKPDGDGPFPAVVLLHDCSGLGPRSSGSPGRWAQELVRRGYVVIIPDSFSTRGLPNGVCTDASGARGEVGPERRAGDAHDALAFARTLPYVDGARVGVMGGSHGGATTLFAVAQPGFKAGIALYPRCGSRAFRPQAPVLILAGELDDWTPAEDCRRLAAAAQAAGYPVAIKVYSGAHHSFDSANPQRFVAARINPNSPSGRGATTAGNIEAWRDSILQVEAFLAKNL